MPYVTTRPRLEDHFDSELDLPLRDGRPGQPARHAGRCSSPIENVRVVRSGRRRKVGMVHDVKDLSAELHVEILRDLLDAIVLVPFAKLRLANKAKFFAAVKVVNILINVALNFILILKYKMGSIAVGKGNFFGLVGLLTMLEISLKWKGGY